MWELTEPQHFTMSKISCWQALSRAVDLADGGHLPGACVPRWQRERERIVEWIDAHCWVDAKQAYSFYAGSDGLDASLALAARFGFKGRHCLSSTIDAIRTELGHGPWIYRYSGADAEEGAFVACTFWLVQAYAELGRANEARALMDEALAGIPPGVGLLAEMIDPGKRGFPRQPATGPFTSRFDPRRTVAQRQPFMIEGAVRMKRTVGPGFFLSRLIEAHRHRCRGLCGKPTLRERSLRGVATPPFAPLRLPEGARKNQNSSYSTDADQTWRLVRFIISCELNE